MSGASPESTEQASPSRAGGLSRVVVVGGGVIGAACAYYLRQRGCAVTLIEQGDFGRGASHGNCGYVSPSHVLPLATRPMLWEGLRSLTRRNAPLQVRWRLEPALWRWFWQFARRTNRRDILRCGHAIQAMLVSARSLYDELIPAPLSDCDWTPGGLLFVYRTQQGMEHYAATDRLLREEFNAPSVRYEGAALAAFEPALLPSCAGAWYYPTDAHLRPDKLMAAWRRALATAGVEVREHCALVDLEVDRRVARQLVTSQGPIATDQVVVATGAWTPQLKRMLRAPIPIQPGKGYSMTMPRPALCPRYPLLLKEQRVAITPMSDAYRIGSTMEFAGYDASLNPERLRLLAEGAALYLKEPSAQPVLESWCGWRPMTPDSLPYVGRVPALDNVYLAAGHGMLGVSMSPATGRLVAEIVCGQTPHIDPQPYAVGR